MAQLFANNVEMQLASNLGTTDTSFAVRSGQGRQCPAISASDANFMLLTFTDKNGNKEIVKVIEHLSGSDVFTIGDDESVPHSASVDGRAYEATFDGYKTALAIVATDAHKIRMPITAKTFQDALGFAAVTATANEVSSVCMGNTATAEELSELHGAGAVKADFQALHASVKLPLGYLQRPKFSYIDADTITIGPGVYHHSGTTEQIVYWNSTLTFDSTDTGSQWYYLYLDDSAIVTHADPLLTASEFCISTTAPTWSDAKHGWYNGLDRCIFACYVQSGTIQEFSHDGGDYVRYETGFTESEFPTDPSSETTVTLTIPAFCTKAMVSITGLSGANGNLAYVMPSTGNDGLYEIAGGTGGFGGSMICFTNSSRQVFVGLADYTGTQTLFMQTRGFFFPTGI